MGFVTKNYGAGYRLRSSAPRLRSTVSRLKSNVYSLPLPHENE